MTGRGVHRLAAPLAGAALVAAVATGATAGAATATVARPVAERSSPSSQDDGDGRLRVAESPEAPYFDDLTPGEPRYWAVTAWLEGGRRARLSLRLQGDGALVTAPRHGLRVSVRRCTRAYPTLADRVRPPCPGREAVVVPDQPLRAAAAPTTDVLSRSWRLPDLTDDRREHLLVTLGLPASGAGDASVMAASASFGVGLHASGDLSGPAGGPASPDDGPWRLPATGGPGWWSALLGGCLVAAGAAVAGRARSRRG